MTELLAWVNFAFNVLTLGALLYFVRQQHASTRREEEMWDVLQLVKGYKDIGRIHHKEADAARDDAKHAAEEFSQRVEQKTEELCHKIDAVPDKVVERIVGAADSTTNLPVVKPASGVNRVPKPAEG